MRNQKTYFLDLQTLLTYLHDQSCELTTEVNVSGKRARGSIVLEEGKVVRCFLSLQNGFQITGEKAYKQLEACTQWQVELEQFEEKKKVSSPAPFSTSPTSFVSRSPASANQAWYFPPLRLKKPLEPALLQNIPLRERFILRSVFSMINGKRNSEEIKAQLPLSPREIDDTLARLRALDLIE